MKELLNKPLPNMPKSIKEKIDNSNITINQMVIKLEMSEPGIKKNLKQLTEKNLIRRIGSKKTGYWEVLK